ncbi:dUTP diphosphatase [Candidatus Woesearchaeota archaeon]|nr:dUTP diphosphatase [Candidatus Woesearchaeota archaeon]
MVAINIKRLREDALLPRYAHEGDAGMDLCSADELRLDPGEQKAVATGISCEIPIGYAGLIWDRSGIAANHAVHTLAGVVDATYRGEIKVVMINSGKKAFEIEKGMRVAQMLIQPVESAVIRETEELPSTKRGEGGFGSTGRR